jgi:ATP-binding cassette subfamily C protein
VISAAYILLAIRVSPAMTSLVMICGLALAVGVRHRIRHAHDSGEQRSAAVARLYAAILEHLGSMKMAKGYGVEGRHADRFARLAEDVRDIERGAVGGHAAMRQWLAVASAAVLATIVYIAHGVFGIQAATLILLLFLFSRLVPRLTGIYEKAQLMATELPAFEAILAAEQRCVEAAVPPVVRHRDVAFADRVELDGVTFHYGDGDHPPALHGVHLVIPARSTTAIVGPSGAGKSTIADLLMGLLHPTAGRVLVDGVALDSEGLQSWRNRIGYVPQDTFLFHDTVLANLLWARPGTTLDEVWRALRMAAADEFVRGLPNGLDTIVGDRGMLVSGGERQRLSLARALLRQPHLLILDEATSSLDSENERRIQRAIEQLHEQVTIVVITHRLSTIRNADLIHVVDGGAIVESGRWEDLSADPSGRFRALCQAQGVDSEPARPPRTAGPTLELAVR